MNSGPTVLADVSAFTIFDAGDKVCVAIHTESEGQTSIVTAILTPADARQLAAYLMEAALDATKSSSKQKTTRIAKGPRQ